MKHYKNHLGQVFGFDDDQLHLLTQDMIELSDVEFQELCSPTPTQEELQVLAKSAVYQLLDTTVQQYDYRNFAEVAQFVNSGVWKAEAEGLLAWQDAVWVKAYELLKAPITSVDDFVAQLPKFVSKPD